MILSSESRLRGLLYTDSHCLLDELPLLLALPPGVEEAASHSQSSAGLGRVELNNGQ